MADPKLCSIPGCDKPACTKGWCRGHYRRFLRHGDPEGGRPIDYPKSCTVPGCDEPFYCREWCITHYQRWQRHGDPEGYATNKSTSLHPIPLAERLMSRVVKQPSGCWEWTGGTCYGGHGTIGLPAADGGGNAMTHRVSWTIHRGPIPEGLNVLHKCDNPPCVNPDHLFLGTQADNIADMIAKRRNVFGEQHYQCKLSDDAVASIRDDPRPHKEIANDHGVSQGHVSEIKARKVRKRLFIRPQVSVVRIVQLPANKLSELTATHTENRRSFFMEPFFY